MVTIVDVLQFNLMMIIAYPATVSTGWSSHCQGENDTCRETCLISKKSHSYNVGYHYYLDTFDLNSSENPTISSAFYQWVCSTRSISDLRDWCNIDEVSYIKHLADVYIWSFSYPVLTCFSMKLMHSSSLARVATKESLVTERVAEFNLLATRSSSVKYDSLLLMLSATLTSFVCIVHNNYNIKSTKVGAHLPATA